MISHIPGRFECDKRRHLKKSKMREARNHLATVESAYIAKIKLVNSDNPGSNTYAGIPAHLLP